jgi:hypothetical protein
MRRKYNKTRIPHDKTEHKVVSYFILRKLGKLMPLSMAKKLTRSLMKSKELLDRMGLGDPEEGDLQANEIGIEEAAKDVINKRPYRYKITTKKVVMKFLRYLRLIR